jgi:hypothetical protein
MNQEKLRITCALCILADGSRLPPFLIFKAKPNKNLEKKLQENQLVKSKKVMIHC